MDKIKLKSLLVPPDMTIKKAMQRLSETSERILFVVDKEDRLVGTITDGDLRRGIIAGKQFDEGVKGIMHHDFISVMSGLRDIEKSVKELMIKTEIEQIPVLNEQGQIVDVILWTDLLDGKRIEKAKEEHDNQVVIMAGGQGTRLDPLTRILPKPLVPIGNKPVIEVIMERFYQYGFSKFIYTLNYKKEYIKFFLKENTYPYQIDWAEEDDFLGTAGGLILLKDKITSTFFVTNCDSLLEVDFEKILAWHKENDSALTIVGCHNEVKIPFGVLEISNGKLEKILEKPTHDVMINTGVYVMEPHVISYLPDRQPFAMDELIMAVSGREKVTVYPIYGGWLDIGQWEEYNRTLKELGPI